MKALTVAASIMVVVAGTGVQDLSSQDIAAAIEQGRAGKTLQKKCGAYGENGFDIIVEGPVGRIMRAVREARKADREFTAADVTPALSASVLTVTARRDATLTTARSAEPMPGAPGVWTLPEAAQADRARERLTMGQSYRAGVELRSKRSGAGEPVVVKPRRPVVYSDSGAFDDVRRSRRPEPNTDMVASFEMAAFRAMPQGDVEVVAFMTDAGERICRISDKDRRAIR